MNPSWFPRVGEAMGRSWGSGVVVAVSGGGDSVGLLRALVTLGEGGRLRISVAHLDHGVRGEESRGDARFVADLASSLGLPFDLGEWRASRTGHFEADARRARYAWLAEVARGRGAAVVAVGQTLDDQAETILHRVLRGSGVKGLSGMPGRRRMAEGLTLVRPLLEITRREVRDYLAAIGQDFVEDSSNLDTSKTRARIRHELLPVLADRHNPNIAEALVRLGRLASGASRTLEKLARDRAQALVSEAGPGLLIFRRPGLAHLSRFDRGEVLRHAWRRAGWPEGAMDARRWGKLARLAASDEGRISVGAGVEAMASPDQLVLRRLPRLPDVAHRHPVLLPIPGRVAWEGGEIVATLDDCEAADERVDLDQVNPPLVVRPPEAGDRFGPLGLEGGTQALSDFFRGRRVERSGRASVPIVVDGSGIVWVAGHRIAHRVRRTESTRRVLGLRWEPGRFPA